MKYPIVTAGEQLAYFVEDRMIPRSSWDRIAESLVFTGRADGFLEFFHEMTVVNLTCKIVIAGTSLLKARQLRPRRSITDSSFEMEFRDFIRDRLGVRPPLLNDMIRNALRAVESAEHDVTPNEQRRFKKWAERAHAFCYLCGSNLDFTGQNPVHGFSLDHIWPQCFGGDSVEDNWLPACVSCNNDKKGNYASWAMPDIQSVVLGFAPTEPEYASVHGRHRFAVHQLAAKRLAVKRMLSLKRAYMLLGPWDGGLRVIDDYDLGDFFNLAVHRSNLDPS